MAAGIALDHVAVAMGDDLEAIIAAPGSLAADPLVAKVSSAASSCSLGSLVQTGGGGALTLGAGALYAAYKSISSADLSSDKVALGLGVIVLVMGIAIVVFGCRSKGSASASDVKALVRKIEGFDRDIAARFTDLTKLSQDLGASNQRLTAEGSDLRVTVERLHGEREELARLSHATTEVSARLLTAFPDFAERLEKMRGEDGSLVARYGTLHDLFKALLERLETAEKQIRENIGSITRTLPKEEAELSARLVREAHEAESAAAAAAAKMSGAVKTESAHTGDRAKLIARIEELTAHLTREVDERQKLVDLLRAKGLLT